jgi:hypothetical protein
METLNSADHASDREKVGIARTTGRHISIARRVGMLCKEVKLVRHAGVCQRTTFLSLSVRR